MSSRDGHRILVTGAGGFVGRWLLRELAGRLSAGDQIIAAFHKQAPSREAHVAFDVDLTQAAKVSELITAAKPTAVIHLAAVSAVTAAARDPGTAWDVNVKSTHYLAEAFRRQVPHGRFVYISSGEVYGGDADGRPAIDETTSLKPRNLYAVTKAAADLLIAQMAWEGLDAIRFRPFNHIGPGQGTDFAISSFSAQIAKIEAGLEEPVISVGDLSAMRDFCDVRDVVRAYADAALAATAAVPVVNLASGHSSSMRAILDTLLGMATKPIDVRVDPARLRASEPARPDVDTTLAKSALNWQARIPLGESLRDVLSVWRSTVDATVDTPRASAPPQQPGAR